MLGAMFWVCDRSMMHWIMLQHLHLGSWHRGGNRNWVVQDMHCEQTKKHCANKEHRTNYRHVWSSWATGFS